MWKLSCVVLMLVVIGCSSGPYSQGQRLVDEGRYDQAIDLFYNQIRANPKDAGAWRELGVAFYEKGDLTKAEDALKQANNIRPDSRTHLYLGLIYEKSQDYGRAIDAYRAALSLGPNSKTKTMLQAHLDLLTRKKIQQEVSRALAAESDINVDTIPNNTIAVVDFDGSHLPPDLAPISKGLAEFTALDLGKVKSLRIVDRTKIDAILRELKLSSSRYADPATAPRIGRLMGSNHIVTGTVLGIGDDEIKLDGAVVSTRDSLPELTPPVQGNLEKIFAIQKKFVFDVIDSLGIKLTPDEREAIQKIPTESYLAFLAYSRGLDYKSKGMFQEAQSQFRDAVRMDGGFQPAVMQSKALSAAPAMDAQKNMTPEAVENSLVAASESGEGGENLAQFQSGAIGLTRFIHDPGLLDQFGNTPDVPDRTIDFKKIGTVTIRGSLDVEP
jgi:tetratricopeptide (TPR) repeat protein